ncbi:MAG: response regulator [Planctomycetes bacterium]|nr:response regulator [Planctomycetota bacterium]
MATILIAEDDASIRRVCVMWLAREGHTVIEAADGQAAMELLQTQDVDLLVSDVEMPRLSGTDLVAWWRVEKKSSRPVIMISATYRRSEVDSRMRNYDIQFMPKPFSPLKLAQAVEDLLVDRASGSSRTANRKRWSPEPEA